MNIVIFFIDRSLGRHIFPSILKKHKIKVEIHDDHLPMDARDEQWLDLVGQQDWVAVTKDRRIQYRSLEMQALINAGVRTFILVGKNKTAKESANQFLKAINNIYRVLAEFKGPFIAKVYADGKVSKIFDKKDLLNNRSVI